MSDIQVDEQERGHGRKALSNGAVFGFIAARWMRRPWRLALITTLMLGGTLCDLGIPWAAGALVEAVSNPLHRADSAWRAWAMLSALYLAAWNSNSFSRPAVWFRKAILTLWAILLRESSR